MPEKREGWIDIADLMPKVSIQDIAAHFRFDLGQNFGSSGEQRTRCPAVSCDGHDDYRSASIDVSDPKGKWKCHRSGYGCGAAGDKLTFISVLENGAMPANGKLIGQDFREAAKTLQAIAGGATPTEKPALERPIKQTTVTQKASIIDDQPNSPLAVSEKENIQRLANLDQHFVLDPSELPPLARQFMQSHAWMSDLTRCKSARCGYLPKSSKGTLRGHFVYGIFDDQGEVLSWVGRNVNFEDDIATWEATGRKDKEPCKYKFPSKHYFRRKFELYGQEAIGSEENAETLTRLGLTITEGFNDVLHLRALGLPSVGIMSNRMTPEQISKAVRFASEFADGKINILFDTDVKGDEGAKETIWQLAQTGLDVRLGWSRAMNGEAFKDREAESLTNSEFDELQSRLQR